MGISTRAILPPMSTEVKICGTLVAVGIYVYTWLQLYEV